MARTPDDVTKAQVWVTGEGPEYGFEFYFPRGAKGEPGGITTPAALAATTDLNSVLTDGVYQFNNVPVPSLYNHPPTLNQGYGVMYVSNSDTASTRIVQTVYPTASGMGGRVIFQRSRAGGVWSPWRAYGTQRVDQTAGRAIYAYDDVNAREQLIYGDTGLRDVKADISSGAANLMSLRRVGNQVYFRVVTWSKDPAGIGNEVIYTLPNGFRPDTTLYSVPAAVRGAATLCQFDVGSAGSIVQQTPLATSSVQLNATWVTSNTWPTTLPGVPSGSIPNL